jgi:Na+-translocating ferredoxin:NAD+ oxidoreductase RnfG subunit
VSGDKYRTHSMKWRLEFGLQSIRDAEGSHVGLVHDGGQDDSDKIRTGVAIGAHGEGDDRIDEWHFSH